MQNPIAPIDDAVGEWVELYNAGPAPLQLQGVVLADDATAAERFIIDADLVLAQGDYLVIARAPDVQSFVPATLVWDGSLSLGNAVDGLILEDAEGNELDRVIWDNGVTFPDPNGASMQLDGRRDPGAVDNAVGGFWCEADTNYTAENFGTPGAPNTACPPPDPAAVQALLDRDCIGCHGGSGGINLENVANLVPGVTAGNSGLPAIVAGDAEASYLYAKLAGTHVALGGFGSRMPLGGAGWPAAELQVVADYINLLLPPQD
ncbi:MAG: lamin tail domain-containing protein [Myxococcales bacterium]|nr:lamin tail domain-containing protein [Myxococcales bacterium]